MAETERFDSNGNRVDGEKKSGKKIWVFAAIIILIYIATN